MILSAIPYIYGESAVEILSTGLHKPFAMNRHCPFVRCIYLYSWRKSVLSSEVPESFRSGIYTFKAKLFASVERLSHKNTAPKLAIVYVLDQEWKLSPDAFKSCNATSDLNVSPSDLKLPSEGKET